MTPLLLVALVVVLVLAWDRDLRRTFLGCIVCILAMGLIVGVPYLVLHWLAGGTR